MRVLVIEDEVTLNKNICEALLAENFTIESVFDGDLATRFLKKEVFDCVVIDINLPKKNGYDLCREFRLYNTHTPVLMLTAFDELEDKIKGFDSGADDYLTKPFFMKELILRINSLIKRSKKESNTNFKEVFNVLDLTINTAQKKVLNKIKKLNLTPENIKILINFAKNNEKMVLKAK